MSKPAISERTLQIADGVGRFGNHGTPYAGPEPHEPTEVESLLFLAREAFATGRQCAGWDYYEEAGKLAGCDF